MGNIFDDLTSGTTTSNSHEPGETGSAAAGDDAQPADSYTAQAIKNAVQELLKFGMLEAERKPNIYRTAITHHARIDAILEPLDLRLTIDDVRGLAFVQVARNTFDAEDDDWQHPLVRRQRLTLEQSLLVAILRQLYLAHEQEAGVGASGTTVSLEEIAASLQLYIGDSGSDARDEKRLRTLLDALRSHGIVSEVDEKAQVNIRPLITHLANPESLYALLQYFQEVATRDQDI